MPLLAHWAFMVLLNQRQMVLNTFPFCTFYSTFFLFCYIALSFTFFFFPHPPCLWVSCHLHPLAFLVVLVTFQTLPMFLQNWKHFQFLLHMAPWQGSSWDRSVTHGLYPIEMRRHFFSSRVAPHLLEVFGHWGILTRSQPIIISCSPLPGTWPILFADPTAALTDRDGQDPGFYNAIMYMNLLRPFWEVPELSQGNPWLSETWLISAMQFLQPAAFPESPTASDLVYIF